MFCKPWKNKAYFHPVEFFRDVAGSIVALCLLVKAIVWQTFKNNIFM
jgi:hypothetical protein